MALLKLAFTVVLVLVPRLVTANGDDVAKRGSNVERSARAFGSQANTVQMPDMDISEEFLVRLRAGSDKVAFSVRYKSDPIYLSNKGVLKLDNMITSVGGGYDPSTGRFTAPVSGLYVFFARVMQHNFRAVEIGFHRGGEALTAMHAHGGCRNDQGLRQATD